MKFKFLLSTALITTLVACGGAEERKSVYMEKAKASIEVGDLDKARIELKNVLQIDPKDSEAYYQLGSVYEQQRSYAKAYRNYLKAEELNPEFLENQAKLGRFYVLLMNENEKAQEKVDFILSKEPENADGLLLKSVVLYRGDKKKEAVAVVKKIIAKNPNHTESVAFLASIYGKEDKFKEAIELLDSSLKHNENNETLNSQLAAALVNNKEYERAEVIYKSFLERNPDSKASYTNLAAFYNKSGNEVKAEEILRASVENDMADVDRQLTLIKYIKSIKGSDAAVDELKSLISRQKGVGELRTALIDLYLLEKDTKSAAEVCNQAIVDFSEEETGIKARLALATIYISEKKYSESSEIVEAAVSISPNDPAVNFVRAKLALRDKDIEKAIISLRIVTKEKPEYVEAYILLSNAYLLEKNNEQASSTLNTAHANNKSNAAGLLQLAQYQLSRDIDQASRIIDDYNNIKENDHDGLSIKSAILNQKKDYAEAFKIAETLMELYPDKPNGYLQAIPYYGQKGDEKKAVAVLEKGYLNAKDNRKLLLLLTTLQSKAKKFDIVIDRVKAEVSAAPDDIELKILLAKVYILDNKTNMAKALLNEELVTNAGSEELYLLLSQAYEVEKNSKASKSTLVKGAANVPASTRIPLKLASIHEMDKEYGEAIDIYFALNQSQPTNLMVINNLAALLSDRGDDDGLKLAKTLVQKLEGSNQPAFLDTVGWVYYKVGDAEKAVQNLSAVVKIMPDVSVFNYHLGMAYKLLNDKVKAKIYLEKSLAGRKEFKGKAVAEDTLKNL